MPQFILDLPINGNSCAECPFYLSYENTEYPPLCILFRETIADKTRCDLCLKALKRLAQTLVVI